jgi:hypothetical protein
VPFILSDPVVDRYEIWANTSQPDDLAFIDALTEFDKVRVIPRPLHADRVIETIYAFWPTATEPDTVYIRFDDDVVFMEEGAIGRLAAYRIAHPKPFMVAPVIINNAVVSCLLQARGILPPTPVLSSNCEDPVGWADADYAAGLWDMLLARIARGDVASLHTADTVIGFNRFSINCVSWLGDTMASIDGKIALEEEFDITVTQPARLEAPNELYGGAVVGHFSFYTQRHAMDRSGMLARISKANSRLPYVDPAIRRRVGEIVQEVRAVHPPEAFMHKLWRVGKMQLEDRLGLRRPGQA